MEELKSYLNGIVCATCLTSDRELHHIQDLPKIQELLPDIHVSLLLYNYNYYILLIIYY